MAGSEKLCLTASWRTLHGQTCGESDLIFFPCHAAGLVNDSLEQHAECYFPPFCSHLIELASENLLSRTQTLEGYISKDIISYPNLKGF
jgi:hypothetical protein